MALSVTHTTASDASFSAAGAAAWDAGHSVAGSVDGTVPVGGIIFWPGTIASIPANWAFCDGVANAPGPNLCNKFPVGAISDDLGVAKTSIEGALSQSGGATGHLHSAHADLTHAGITIGDHTGLTHALAIANHPDLTHAALSHAAQTFTHADHAVASVSHTHAGITHADLSIPTISVSNVGLTHADLSIPTISVSNVGLSHADLSFASRQADIAAIAGKASFASGTNRSGMTSVPTNTGSLAASTYTIVSHPTHSGIRAAHTETIVSHPTHSGIRAAFTQTIVSHPTFSGTGAATTLTHADHSLPSLSHQAIGTHVGTDYGVHAITQPNDHGVAGTLTHSFSQPNNHVLSLHDTVSNVPNYYALAFIQRMS